MFSAFFSAVTNILTEVFQSAIAFGMAMAINYITSQF
jgi:hypothetical protein